MTEKVRWSVGMMSGTSLDGIDVALLRTDGNEIAEIGAWLTVPYDPALRSRIREAIYMRGDILAVERDMTLAHVDAVRVLLKQASMRPKDIEVIGFHGQTITHRPQESITWQMGNGALLAEKSGIAVMTDFRRRDVACGGQGAPLVPLFHAALVRRMELPIVIINIGGIANVTWVGRSENTGNDIMAMDIFACDTGPGNVLINEWVLRHTGDALDRDGAFALRGKVNASVIDAYMTDPFFSLHPPKSLDRNYFSLALAERLSVEDGAATLTMLTATAIARAQHFFPVPAKRWYVSGGGRHNPALMHALKQQLTHVEPVETLGWQGDALEAQAFAFLAKRALRQLPLTLPTTTGSSRPATGGSYYAY